MLCDATTEEVLAAISEPPSREDRDDMRAAGGGALGNPLRALRPVAPNLIGKVGTVGAVGDAIEATSAIPGVFQPKLIKSEVAALGRTGARTIVLTPTDEVVDAADGFPLSRPKAGAEIVSAAREQTMAAFTELRRRRHG